MKWSGMWQQSYESFRSVFVCPSSVLGSIDRSIYLSIYLFILATFCFLWCEKIWLIISVLHVVLDFVELCPSSLLKIQMFSRFTGVSMLSVLLIVCFYFWSTSISLYSTLYWAGNFREPFKICFVSSILFVSFLPVLNKDHFECKRFCSLSFVTANFTSSPFCWLPAVPISIINDINNLSFLKAL